MGQRVKLRLNQGETDSVKIGKTDSDTNLTIVCGHRWSRQMAMKVHK